MEKTKKVTEAKAKIKGLPAYRLTGVTEEASWDYTGRILKD